jgi:hypothetical protein
MTKPPKDGGPRDVNRDRGILTPRDRKLLLDHPENEIEPGSHTERRARQEIRDRIYDSLLDFVILYEGLSDRDRDLIFGTGEKEGDRYHRGHLHFAVINALAFIMVSVGAHLRDAVGPGGRRLGLFWHVTEEAFKKAGIREGVLIDEVEPPQVHGRRAPRFERIIERAQAGEELSGSEIELLLQGDRVDRDRVFEAIADAVAVEDGEGEE